MAGRTLSFLNCPRCGLSIRQSARFSVDHCPRCLAQGISVALFSSTLPTSELYGDGSTPTAEPSASGAR